MAVASGERDVSSNFSPDGAMGEACLSQEVSDLLLALQLQDCSEKDLSKDLNVCVGLQEGDSGRTTVASSGGASGSNGGPASGASGCTAGLRVPHVRDSPESYTDQFLTRQAPSVEPPVQSVADATLQTYVVAPSEHVRSESLDDLLLALADEVDHGNRQRGPDIRGDTVVLPLDQKIERSMLAVPRGDLELDQQLSRPVTATLEDSGDEWDFQDGRMEVDELIYALDLQAHEASPASPAPAPASPRNLVSPVAQLDAMVAEAEGLLMALGGS